MMCIPDVVAQRDLTMLDEPRREGPSTVVTVMTRAGVKALLYADTQEPRAARAARIHDRVGPQLFVVPELIASGPYWWMVRQPDGKRACDLGEWKVHEAAVHAASLGKALRKLHEVPCEPYSGDVLDPAQSESLGRWLTFNGYAAHQLDWFAENLRLHDFAPPQLDHLARVIGDLRHELASFHPRNAPTLCHGSLSLDHIWIDGGEVSGLTGFQFAAQVPREADIAYLLWIGGLDDELLVRRFYEGYGSARTMDVQRRERFYRRLVALQALFKAKGEVSATTEQLIALTSPMV